MYEKLKRCFCRLRNAIKALRMIALEVLHIILFCQLAWELAHLWQRWRQSG
jgi:hypothetical protein